MINKTIRHTFQTVLYLQGIVALLLAVTGKASALNIKDTNYPIPSGAYFVSPSGKDTNCKSSNSPCSVVKALRAAPSGATIIFRGGTYRNLQDLRVNKKLKLQAYPHEKPWLKGSTIVTGWVADGSTWRKDGWTYSFPSKVASASINPKYPMAGYGDMVFVNGVSLKQVSSKAKVVAGTFYVDSGRDKLYIGSSPAGKTVEATKLTHALSIWGSNASGTIVRGLGFTQYADTGIKVGAPRVTLENNTIGWNGSSGAYFFKTSPATSNAVVRGNTFSYNAKVGLAGEAAHSMLLENNTISYNNVEHFTKTWEAAGAKFIRSNGLLWRNNHVHHNYANGLWLDQASTDATVVKNTVADNQGLGIFFEVSHKAIIAANVAYNNIVGIMTADSSSVRVYNNTLYRNSLNLRLKETTRTNTNSAQIAQGVTWISRNNVFKNNIISDARGSSLFDAANCGVSPSSTTVAAADYNAYHRKSSSTPKSAIKWSLSGNCSASYNSVLAFKLATGYEDNALVIDNVATDPFFVNAANGDYRLKSGSRAIGRGQALPKDVAKAIGLPSGVPVDLGALQSRAFVVQ